MRESTTYIANVKPGDMLLFYAAPPMLCIARSDLVYADTGKEPLDEVLIVWVQNGERRAEAYDPGIVLVAKHFSV